LGTSEGVALVLVLWITVLLTIMAGAFTLTIQREAKLVGNLKAGSEANALAEAGLHYAMLMLSVKDTKDAENAWKADRSVHAVPFNDSVIEIQIGDERGKIDLNLAGRELLLKLFTGINLESGDADKLADAILDWRDKNDEVQMNGAEKKDYQQHNLSYAPRNAPFQSIEELQFVLGVTPQLYKKLAPMLTVYSGSATVDIKKAPSALQRILNPEGDAGESGKQAGNTAGPGGADTDSQDKTDPESDSETDAEAGSGANTGSSGVYSIYAGALLPGGRRGQIEILARREGSSAFTILSWKYVTDQNRQSAGDNLGNSQK
jgi:general secretion pathway protein K